MQVAAAERKPAHQTTESHSIPNHLKTCASDKRRNQTPKDKERGTSLREIDEASIGQVISEMYAMVSGPAGPRDWSRSAKCFSEDALQVRTWLDEHGHVRTAVMNLEEYEAECRPFFDENAFYETEVERRIRLFPPIAHVWSSYEIRLEAKAAEPYARGVNSIQLVRFDDCHWRIIHMVWSSVIEPNRGRW